MHEFAVGVCSPEPVIGRGRTGSGRLRRGRPGVDGIRLDEFHLDGPLLGGFRPDRTLLDGFGLWLRGNAHIVEASDRRRRATP